MHLKTIIIFTILTNVKNHMGVQCKELYEYLSFNTNSMDIFHKKCEELILYYIQLNSNQFLEAKGTEKYRFRETIKSLRSDFLRLLLLSNGLRLDYPTFGFYKIMHEHIEKFGYMHNKNIYMKITILNSGIIQDDNKHLNNLMICKRTFESICKRPVNLEKTFLDEIHNHIKTLEMNPNWTLTNSSSKWDWSAKNTGFTNTSSNSISMYFGNIIPLMNEDDFMNYIRLEEHDNQKFFLNKIMINSLTNIFNGMNHILNKLPFRKEEFIKFSILQTYQTKRTDDINILLIFKSMLEDVINATTVVVKIQMCEDMQTYNRTGKDYQYSLDSQLYENYKIFIHNTIVKWNDMCPKSVKEDHIPNQLTQFPKNINGEITEDFIIESSMYGYYLLDTSEDIYNSFLNGNDIITDKRLLLDMKLWLLTIKKDAEVLLNNGPMSLDEFVIQLSNDQKILYNNIDKTIRNLSDFIQGYQKIYDIEDFVKIPSKKIPDASLLQ